VLTQVGEEQEEYLWCEHHLPDESANRFFWPPKVRFFNLKTRFAPKLRQPRPSNKHGRMRNLETRQKVYDVRREKVETRGVVCARTHQACVFRIAPDDSNRRKGARMEGKVGAKRAGGRKVWF
jgi:hypothetical protein